MCSVHSWCCRHCSCCGEDSQASDSTATVAENASNVVIPLSATDPNSPARALAYVIATQPAHGTLGTVSGNTVTYTPAAGYFGPDSFRFKVNNGVSDSNIATVSVTIVAPPTASVGLRRSH